MDAKQIRDLLLKKDLYEIYQKGQPISSFMYSKGTSQKAGCKCHKCPCEVPYKCRDEISYSDSDEEMITEGGKLCARCSKWGEIIDEQGKKKKKCAKMKEVECKDRQKMSQEEKREKRRIYAKKRREEIRKERPKKERKPRTQIGLSYAKFASDYAEKNNTKFSLQSPAVKKAYKEYRETLKPAIETVKAEQMIEKIAEKVAEKEAEQKADVEKAIEQIAKGMGKKQKGALAALLQGLNA